MKQRIECNVDRYDDSIRVTPSNAQPQNTTQKKKRRKAHVYEWADSSIDIFFPKKGNLLKEPTIVELKRFSMCKICHSKHRINIHLSFDKCEVEAAEKTVRTNYKQWFEEIKNLIKAEKDEK
ncbi:MAG: hypothetical protein HUJ63_02935 [Enterococcus sp.]|nr:hypothetical protein [Enterococcus sp.]